MGIWELFWFRHFSLFLDPKPTGAYLGSDFPDFEFLSGFKAIWVIKSSFSEELAKHKLTQWGFGNFFGSGTFLYF